jgi:hypothetical protein
MMDPLTELTKKTPSGKEGPFHNQCSRPFRNSKGTSAHNPFSNIPEKVDPTTWSPDVTCLIPGGLSAILTQTNEESSHSVLAYASQKLQKHEKNYPKFLFELIDSVWGMEHFSTALKGLPFSLYSDQHPPSKLGKVYTKTLHHL